MHGDALGNGSYPYLHLTIDGREVELFWEQQKGPLTEAGLTYLGWEDELLPMDVEIPAGPAPSWR